MFDWIHERRLPYRLQLLWDRLVRPISPTKIVYADGLKFRVRRCGGLRDPDEFFVQNIVVKGEYDFYKPSGTVVDIGANIGVFTCWAARSSSRVISVEPEQYNFKLLKMNVNLNKANAELHRAAIGDKSGSIELSLGGAGYHSTTRDFGGEKQTVQVVTLDELLSNVERVDLLKMDCEGAEYNAFRAFKSWNKVHRIAMEYHAPSISAKSGCVRELVAILGAGGLTVERHDEFPEFASGHLFAKR